jgi:hypothetical protein
VGSIESGFTVRPEYYGLMLAQQFAGRSLCRATLEAQDANVTAYAAAGDGAAALVAIINKDGRDAELTIAESSAGFKRATVERLEASAIDAKDGVTFKGNAVRSDGQFHPRAGEPMKLNSGKMSIRLPGYSAALIRLE